MEIDKKSPVPIYYQIKQIILEKIRMGEWIPDSTIPSERELSEIFQVSRMTIRQAINELVGEDILYREKGKGTFVNHPRIEQYDIMSFTEAATDKGYEASTSVRLFKVETPDISTMDKLGLTGPEDVYYIQRLRMIESQVVGVEEIYLPVRLCSNLEKRDLSGSLYKILKEDYGYTIDHIQTSLEAILPEKEDLKLFNAEKNIPLLKVTGINITDGSLKLFYEESIYRSDKYILNVNISRR